ncbi:hypothetical protein L1987_02013 [Smallanthus sonchifolius]|uniref:Uncharacterized protein n=1 Tax=Smallanthus sonchifolius TaxID=185202 RepID=A0ACB9K6M5_9ASTR|nr:hypothetical protein L1987_02013 [Smallanthus sonchifolius]
MGATLSFRDVKGGDRIPTKAILKWMATLERILGDNPISTATLTGIVNGRRIVMSSDTLIHVALFNTRSDHEYVYRPEIRILENAISGAEGAMLHDLFVGGAGGIGYGHFLYGEETQVYLHVLQGFLSNGSPLGEDEQEDVIKVSRDSEEEEVGDEEGEHGATGGTCGDAGGRVF